MLQGRSSEGEEAGRAPFGEARSGGDGSCSKPQHGSCGRGRCQRRNWQWRRQSAQQRQQRRHHTHLSTSCEGLVVMVDWATSVPS